MDLRPSWPSTERTLARGPQPLKTTPSPTLPPNLRLSAAFSYYEPITQPNTLPKIKKRTFYYQPAKKQVNLYKNKKSHRRKNKYFKGYGKKSNNRWGYKSKRYGLRQEKQGKIKIFDEDFKNFKNDKSKIIINANMQHNMLTITNGKDTEPSASSKILEIDKSKSEKMKKAEQFLEYLYFITNDKVYKYNTEEEKVVEGFPISIAQQFGGCRRNLKRKSY